MPRNTRRKRRGGDGEAIASAPNQADEAVNNLGSSAQNMGSSAVESTKSTASQVGDNIGNTADSIASKTSETLGKAKGWLTGWFSSSPPAATTAVGGSSRRRRRGGIGSHWASKSHPLYLNPSANMDGNNIYNLSKGGSVQPYESLESLPSDSKSTYLLNGGKRRSRRRKGKKSKKSRRGRR